LVSLRKKLKHDPEKWNPVFGIDHARSEIFLRDLGAKMSSHRLRSSIVAACALVAAGIGAAQADPRGLWQADDGSRVRIANCGKALCGTMASMATPNDPTTGRPWTDKNNPDPAKKARPLIGIMVLISMQPSAPGKWSGTLYDNDRGITVQGHLMEQGPTIIRVEGCMGAICGGENMTRVSEPQTTAGRRVKPADKRAGDR
jgi:uncharacterized protein (DUF2147 family)